MHNKLRIDSSDSVSSVVKDKNVDVEFQQSTKPYSFLTNVKDTIDQHEVFLEERNNCTNYRLISTIRPFCTNILFNPLTEIVYHEGDSDNIDARWDDVNKELKKEKESTRVYGHSMPNRIQMIQNTEYSRENIGYEYHPGMDIFNNHILRNTSFKIVNPVNTSDVKFNTIEDLLRRYDESLIYFTNRQNINTDPTPSPKHLYNYDDILEFTDCINTNLTEDNGWLGFVNKSSIISKRNDGDNSSPVWVDEDFNHVINNKESCEFIDMYPDRTLFSFNPKYNPYKHRAEYNWNLCLTYPYENFYSHKLILDEYSGEKLNALEINKITYDYGQSGQRIVLFQTYCRHNLKKGDFINLYFRKTINDDYIKVDKIRITNVGDLNNENSDYYFYVTDVNFLTNFLNSTDDDIYEDEVFDDINDNLKNACFRFKHVINDTESEYYIRKFRKLPNFKNEEEKLTLNVAKCTNEYEEFADSISNDFDNEQYQLAFSSTIYNDKNTQVTWTDGINIDNLLDNRGRPLTEIYLTVIKNNKGNKKWYSPEKNYADDDVEYSHCFGEVSCGFDLYTSEDDRGSEQSSDAGKQRSDVKLITETARNDSNFGWSGLNVDDTNITKDITIDKNKYFIGDLVEYNVTTCEEVVLEDCYFRFNTYLREHEVDNLKSFYFDEIETDDYDSAGFVINTNNKTDIDFHPEGYYYKAHYRVALKEFGELHQASHFDIKIKKTELKLMGDKVMLVIKSKLPHKLSTYGDVLICDDASDRMISVPVSYVIDSTTFAIDAIGNLTTKNLKDIFDGVYPNISFKLRRYNEEIPHYADKSPNINRYMWRNVNTVGNKDNKELPEYPYSNGYFYINQDINFYLKRQDPFDEYGLYYSGGDIIPNDVFGNVLSGSNYEYKEETEATC